MEALLIGLSLGMAAGVSPGPLLLLVITSALRGGWRAGVLASCAPLVSDVVVVAATLLVLDRLPESALGYVALAGAVFVAWTGVQTIRESSGATLTPDASAGAAVARQALLRAAVVNLLSPHPWIFWGTVLGPLTLTTWEQQPAGAVALVLGFYATIVGSKALLAVLVTRGRHRLSQRGYRLTLAGAGALLVLAAAVLAAEVLPTVL